MTGRKFHRDGMGRRERKEGRKGKGGGARRVEGGGEWKEGGSGRGEGREDARKANCSRMN